MYAIITHGVRTNLRRFNKCTMASNFMSYKILNRIIIIIHFVLRLQMYIFDTITTSRYMFIIKNISLLFDIGIILKYRWSNNIFIMLTLVKVIKKYELLIMSYYFSLFLSVLNSNIYFKYHDNVIYIYIHMQ